MQTSVLPRQLAIRRELYFFTLYRVLEAALLCLAIFSPVGALIGEPRYPALAALVASSYLAAAVLLFASGRRGAIRGQVVTGIAVDIAASVLAIHAMPSAASGIAMMLLFNVGAAALLLPLRLALGAAAVAACAVFAEYAWTRLSDAASTPAAEVLMFAVSYLAIATLTNLLGRQMLASQALAERRGSQLADLAEVNELIIRRMRTGVLLVDGDGGIILANEAASVLFGVDMLHRRELALVAPQLEARLQRWKQDDHHDPAPLQLVPDMPEVIPRFARLMASGEQVLVFLDDASVATQRAESMTLATLGRFSASLAHEIRNPLAAISYATQLMEESQDIPEADRRLLQIVYQQTQRMNGIVENVLGLAKRERAQPEHVELGEFVRQFVADYGNSHPMDADTLEAGIAPSPIPCMVDRRQLHQVATALVHNALLYGRLPGEPARVSLRAWMDEAGNPLLDVVDRGPGVPDTVARQLFRPFYTTSPHGTGLGLYVARELCLANQASLDYVPLPAGGACFRIRLQSGTRVLDA